MCVVYMLECCDGTLYTGWTNDMDARISAHSSGRGSKYTRSRLPVTLVYTEHYKTRQDAMKRECAIKKLHRSEKLELIYSQIKKKNRR